MREKFRVDKNVNEAKQIVCIGRSEMRIRKSGAKRKYRRRANQILKQTDIENGWDIA